MKAIDSIVAFFSPKAALERVAARKRLEFVASGYSSGGASYAKRSLIGFSGSSSDADSDIVDNLETLRSRSRLLYMTSPLATGAIKTIRTNVVGSGLALNANIDADFLGLSEEEARAWEANTEREWRLWAETVACDAERKQNFYQLQSLVVLSVLLSGDVFAVMPFIARPGCPYDLRISIIEADRVATPPELTGQRNILGGIEVGSYGESVAVHVANRHPYAIPRSADQQMLKYQRIPIFGKTTGRRNVLHVMTDIERPSQRRGLPLLAPVIEELKQLKRYTDAELMAAVVSGMFTVFITSENAAVDSDYAMDYGMDPGPAKVMDPQAVAMGNGSIVALEDGQKPVFANPGRPSTAFDAYVASICKYIGAALELPYELLMKQFTSSYSASRAALLEAWKMFRMRREWLVSSFCRPVYEEWLAEAVAKGRIQAPGFFEEPAVRAAWSGAEWFGDAQGQLDPQKEAAAAKIRVEEGFSTRTREAAELTGMRYDAIMRTRKGEEELRRLVGGGAPAESVPTTNSANSEEDNE